MVTISIPTEAQHMVHSMIANKDRGSNNGLITTHVYSFQKVNSLHSINHRWQIKMSRNLITGTIVNAAGIKVAQEGKGSITEKLM